MPSESAEMCGGEVEKVSVVATVRGTSLTKVLSWNSATPLTAQPFKCATVATAKPRGWLHAEELIVNAADVALLARLRDIAHIFEVDVDFMGHHLLRAYDGPNDINVQNFQVPSVRLRWVHRWLGDAEAERLEFLRQAWTASTFHPFISIEECTLRLQERKMALCLPSSNFTRKRPTDMYEDPGETTIPQFSEKRRRLPDSNHSDIDPEGYINHTPASHAAATESASIQAVRHSNSSSSVVLPFIVRLSSTQPGGFTLSFFSPRKSPSKKPFLRVLSEDDLVIQHVVFYIIDKRIVSLNGDMICSSFADFQQCADMMTRNQFNAYTDVSTMPEGYLSTFS